MLLGQYWTQAILSLSMQFDLPSWVSTHLLLHTKRQIVVGPRGITTPQMFGNSENLVRVGDHPKSMGAIIMSTNVVPTSSSRNFYLAPTLDITLYLL